MKWRALPSGFIVASPMLNSPPSACADRNKIFFPFGDQTGSDDPLVEREMRRTEEVLRLPRPLESYLEDHFVLDPAYFAEWGSGGGAMYGAVRPFWQIGPLHRPPYSDRKRPWLWREGHRCTRAAASRPC